MKIVKLILLITLALVVASKKVERTYLKEKFKWESDYDCGLKVNGKDLGQAKFTPTSVMSPANTEEKIGWVFNFSSGPSGDLVKLIDITSNKKYFPYRLISGAASYVNPNFDNKYISFVMTLDGPSPRTTYNVQVQLPYAKFTWYITDQEAGTLVNYINTNRSNEQRNSNSAKTDLINAINKYCQDKPLLDASLKGDAALNQKITEATNTIAGKQKEIDDLQNQLNNANLEVQKAEAALKLKDDAAKDVGNQLLQGKASVTDAQAAIDATKASLGTSATNVTNLKQAVADAQMDFDNNTNKLKSLCPNMLTTIDAARDAATAKDKAVLSTNINKIYA